MSVSAIPADYDDLLPWRDRLTLRNRGIPAGLSRVMAPLMSLAIRRATQKDLARLKALVEQGS